MGTGFLFLSKKFCTFNPQIFLSVSLSFDKAFHPPLNQVFQKEWKLKIPRPINMCAGAFVTANVNEAGRILPSIKISEKMILIMILTFLII